MQKSMITVAILALSVPAMAQRTITCSSTDGRRHFCAANTQNGVMLLQERSDNLCQQGSTWSYTRQGISVSGGCSADFQIGGSNGNTTNDSYGNSGYGNNNNNGNNRNDGNSANRNNGQNSNGNGYPNNNQNGYPHNNNDDQEGNGNRGYGNRQQSDLVIPSGTRLDVRLEQTLRVAEVNQGDLVPATLVNDVSVNGRVVAPSGTSVQAKVVSARGSTLDLRLDSMTANGRSYKLSSSSIHSAKDSQGGQSGSNQTATEGIGSLIGSLTGGAQLPSGSVYTFRLTSPARSASTNQ